MAVKIIGIISDTHRKIPDKALEIFKGNYDRSRVIEHWELPSANIDVPMQKVDYIIHAGDIGDDTASTQKVLGSLSKIAPVYAVQGNDDCGESEIDGKQITGELLSLDLDGISVTVMHDPDDLTASVKQQGLDPVLSIYGHKHLYKIKEQDSKIRLNPGSIHDPRNDMGYRTVALAYIEDSKLVRAEIVRL